MPPHSTASIDLISTAEIDRARDFLTVDWQRAQASVRRFRNSLELFVNDFRDASVAEARRRIYAVDTTELKALFDRTDASSRAFAFHPLFEQDSSLEGGDPAFCRVLNALDRSVLTQLLQSNVHTVLLLDPFAQEIAAIADTIEQQVRDTITSFGVSKIDEMTIEQIERIEAYLLEPNRSGLLPQEWNLFRRTFLPHWRERLLRSWHGKRMRRRTYVSISRRDTTCICEVKRLPADLSFDPSVRLRDI